MKKTLLASAIAAVTFSGSALAITAEELSAQMDTMPTLSGNVQMAYRYLDNDAGNNGGNFFDNGSTLGVAHDHQIAPGIEAFAKIELQGFESTDASGGGLDTVDETYIGVRGGFGEVWAGKDDSQYEVLIGDYSNSIYQVALSNVATSFDTAEDNLVQYISPSFGGVTVHGVVQIDGEDDPVSNKKNYPYQLGAKYSVDALTVALAMDSNDGSAGKNENSYGVSFEYVIDNLVLDAYYTTRSGVGSETEYLAKVIARATVSDEPLGDEILGSADLAGQDAFGVMATYAIGANQFRVSYAKEEWDVVDADKDAFTLQAIHNVSDNLYVYAEGVKASIGGNDVDDLGLDDDSDEINLGAVYYF